MPNRLPLPVGYHIFRAGSEIPLLNGTLYDYVCHRQGIVKVGQNSFFSAAVPLVDNLNLPGLAPFLLEGICLDIPKLPERWLWAIYHHARQIAQNNNREQMYHIHYDNIYGWRVAVPQQTASHTRIEYEGGHEPSVVIDLHSHGGMPAFFSKIDDADEQGLRIYAVIGQLTTIPEILMRVGVYGDFLEIDPLEVVAGLGPFFVAAMYNSERRAN